MYERQPFACTRALALAVRRHRLMHGQIVFKLSCLSVWATSDLCLVGDQWWRYQTARSQSRPRRWRFSTAGFGEQTVLECLPGFRV